MYALLMSGIPLPVSFVAVAEVEKDRSRPFPCMDRKCGCRTADQCWRSCCCHTVEERVAWAHANGVEVPAFVQAELAAEPRVEQACAVRRAGCADCEAVRQAEVAEQAASCCETEQQQPARAAESDSGGWQTVVLIQALGCQGVDFNLLGVAIAIPVVPMATAHELLAGDWFRPFETPTLPAPAFLPEVPPPQVIV